MLQNLKKKTIFRSNPKGQRYYQRCIGIPTRAKNRILKLFGLQNSHSELGKMFIEILGRGKIWFWFRFQDHEKIQFRVFQNWIFKQPRYYGIIQNCIFQFTPYLEKMDFELVMKNIQTAHPDYNLESHSPFGGFASMRGPIYNINTMILGFVAFTLPILVTCMRRIIVKQLDSLAHNFSKRTLKGSKLLTKVLEHICIHCIFKSCFN